MSHVWWVWWGVGFVERLGGEHGATPAVALAATGGPTAAAAVGPCRGVGIPAPEKCQLGFLATIFRGPKTYFPPLFG